MMMKTEALKLALEALEGLPALNWIPEKDMQVQEAITAIKEALAQQNNEQVEPVAWLVEFENGEQELHFEEQAVGETNTPLYTHPPVPTAQPEQEPSYWIGYGLQAHTEKPFDDATPLYTHPLQRTWVGLTDEERNHARQTVTYSQLAMTAAEWAEEVQKETERRLKEKNHG